MIILAIDTSCDETSVSILNDSKLICQQVSSQAALQNTWGGVVPLLAKRKHFERIEYLIGRTIYLAGNKLGWNKINRDLYKLAWFKKDLVSKPVSPLLNTESTKKYSYEQKKKISYQEETPLVTKNLILSHLETLTNPGIDLIAVTVGPGLAVALEVGIQAAKRLSVAWHLNLAIINHMEAHLWSSLINNSKGKNINLHNLEAKMSELHFPALGLLVSGSHTEIILINSYGNYEVVGETLDDAAGEAYDKFSVMLNLGYPGGAIIESLASLTKSDLVTCVNRYSLPIPLRNNGELNFSFSGLKTAALYKYKELTLNESMNLNDIQEFAKAFQYSVNESIGLKLAKAIIKYKPKLILSGGGVIANKDLRKRIRNLAREAKIPAYFPATKFLQDNASMVGLVAYYNSLHNRDIYPPQDVKENFPDRLPNWGIAKPYMVNPNN